MRGTDRDAPCAAASLRWLTQREIVAIPKSVRSQRMAENIDVFSFHLTDDEMTRITTLNAGRSHIFDHYDPEAAKWLGSTRFDT